jgi:hypothetical protein
METSRRIIRGLIAWNAVLSASAIGLVIIWAWPHAARFTELSVERIDVNDADGTRRMVIANRDRFPNLVINGEVLKRTDRTVLPAGIVVYDEQGNEAGGYGTTSMRDDRGGDMAQSMMVLDYARSDAIGILQRHSADRAEAMLVVNDPVAAGPPAAGGVRRIAVGTADRVSSITLSDTRGRPRIRLAVDASDQPSIVILDEAGAVVRNPEAAPGGEARVVR